MRWRAGRGLLTCLNGPFCFFVAFACIASDQKTYFPGVDYPEKPKKSKKKSKAKKNKKKGGKKEKKQEL